MTIWKTSKETDGSLLNKLDLRWRGETAAKGTAGGASSTNGSGEEEFLRCLSGFLLLLLLRLRGPLTQPIFGPVVLMR
jgi:hypothetical protein